MIDTSSALVVAGSHSGRLKTLLPQAVLLSGSLLFAFVLSEFAIRLVAPQTLALNYTEWDSYVGFKSRANASGFFRNSEFTMSVDINSTGQRDREFPLAKPAGTYRVVVLGDSFTFGHGVAANDTYAKRLGDTPQEPLHRPVESINMGVGKSGTAHEACALAQDCQSLRIRSRAGRFLPRERLHRQHRRRLSPRERRAR